MTSAGSGPSADTTETRETEAAVRARDDSISSSGDSATYSDE